MREEDIDYVLLGHSVLSYNDFNNRPAHSFVLDFDE